MDYTPKAIGRDEFIALFTPGQVINSEGFRTSLAQDRHKGRLVMVHELATSPGEKRRALSLLAQLSEVHGALVIGLYLIGDEPVVVTKFILGFVSFRQWLEHAVAETATVVMDTRDEVPDLDLSRHAGAPAHLSLNTTEMQQVPLNLETVPGLEDTAIGLGAAQTPQPVDRAPPPPPSPAETLIGGGASDGFTEFFANVPAVSPQAPAAAAPITPDPDLPASVPARDPAQPKSDEPDTFSEIFGKLTPVEPPARVPPAPRPVAFTVPLAAPPSPVAKAPPAAVPPMVVPPVAPNPTWPSSIPPVHLTPERQYQPTQAPIVPPEAPPPASDPSITELFGAAPIPAPPEPAPSTPHPPYTPPRPPPTAPAPPARHEGESGSFTQMFGSGDSPKSLTPPPHAPRPAAPSAPQFPQPPRFPQSGAAGLPNPALAGPAPQLHVPRPDVGLGSPPPVPNPSSDWLRGVPQAPKVPFGDVPAARQAERAVESQLPAAVRNPAAQVPGLAAPRGIESSFTEMLKPARPPLQPPAPPALPSPSSMAGAAANAGAKPASMGPLIVVLVVCVVLVVAVVVYAATR